METKMDAFDRVLVHYHPVWRERSNAFVLVQTDCEELREAEQLWVRRLNAEMHEICCIPCFVKDITLGDIVRAEHGVVVDILEWSGSFSYRAWSEFGWLQLKGILDALAECSALMEEFSPNLMGINCENYKIAVNVRKILEENEMAGNLVFDTGWS